MEKQINFCGGLPRSGSTVLMNILQQNPSVFTTGTCALPDILHQHILIKSRFRESHQAMDAQQADSAMYGLIHGATQGWFGALTDKPTVISKNRTWNNLLHLFPNGKFIALVRDLRDVVDSFERLNSNISSLHTFNNNNTLIPAMSTQEKYQYYFNEPNAFSIALNQELSRLIEFWQADPNKILFIRYEDFVKEPKYILQKIYNFLNLNYYDHNLQHIMQSELYEHDNAYFRERTSHKTKTVFQRHCVPIRIITSKLQDKILKDNQWFYESFYPELLKGSQ